MGIGMDSVVPVVVVCGSDAIVASILADQRRVVPGVAGILPGDDDGLTGIAQRPDIVGADARYVPLDAGFPACGED